MEPVNLWKPITDEYKAQAELPAQVQAENQQMLDQVRQLKPEKVWTEKKAPLGIRVFTWYLFCRTGFYALLLFILASFPQTGVSTWLVANLGNFLHMPYSASGEDAARAREMGREDGASGYASPDSLAADQEANAPNADPQRNAVMLYLLIFMVSTAVVAAMWWTRYWKVRWVAMFYAGAFVARTAISYFASVAAGESIQLSPEEASSLLAGIAANGFVFCYLAFWPEVKEWFEEQN